MEMIDVLTKLREIAETKPELVKDALENVTKTNPKIDEGALKQAMHGDAENMSKEEFVKKYGKDTGEFWDNINGTEEAVEGKIPAGLKAYQDKKAGKEEKTDKKETVKEAVQISTDSPQEASMMMQILALAGVRPVNQDMINQGEPEADAGHGCGPSCAEHGCNCEHGQAGHDDAMGSQEMGRMRDMITAPEEEKAEETFANSMGDEKEEPKYQDTDTLVNTMSGGMNRQKKTYPKVASGDNPMAAEDLSNSLRAQYESFKKAYQTEAKAKPDFLDMDKDGDKKEPMKKAIADKEAK